MKRIYEMILFDIDGTLLRCLGPSKRAFNRAFEELFDVTDGWGQTLSHGQTDPLIFSEISNRELGRELDGTEYTELSERFVRYFGEEIVRPDYFSLLPGIAELCKFLSEAENVVLGIETGNFEQTAQLKLKQGQIDHYFAFGGYGSDHSERAELVRTAIERGKAAHQLSDIPSKDIYVIGDAPQDVIAGNSLGANTIAVATGRFNAEELNTHQPSKVFESLENLHEVLNALNLT